MTVPPAKDPIIAISGSPRVGSMWCYNVARSLARSAGLSVVPDRVPQTNEDMFAAGEAYLCSDEADTRCVIKVHTKIVESHHVKVIYGTRDLRDRIYSMCRFRNLKLDAPAALAMAKNSLDMDRHYDQWSPSRLLLAPFEEIENDSAGMIRKIADFMCLPMIDAENIRAIDAELSKSRVKKRIADLDSRARSSDRAPDADPPPVVQGDSGSIRNFDVASGFQSGHVSDYRPGDWRHLWSDEQKKWVDAAICMAEDKLKG